MGTAIKTIAALFICAGIYTLSMAQSAKTETHSTGCPLPKDGQTLFAFGSADGKPVCEYHPTRHYGQAK